MPEREHGMNGDIENEHRSGSREQQIAGDEDIPNFYELIEAHLQ
jgi:hypothetical protein